MLLEAIRPPQRPESVAPAPLCFLCALGLRLKSSAVARKNAVTMGEVRPLIDTTSHFELVLGPDSLESLDKSTRFGLCAACGLTLTGVVCVWGVGSGEPWQCEGGRQQVLRGCV